MILAEKLLEKEVIFKEDLEAIFGKRPFAKDIAEEELKEKQIHEAILAKTEESTPSIDPPASNDNPIVN